MNLFTYICICTQRDTREEVRRQFMGIYSFPNHVGSRNCTQVSRLGRKKKNIYLLNHLTGPRVFFIHTYTRQVPCLNNL